MVQQLLVKITVRNSAGQAESTLYRVPAEARLCDVVATAVDRSELTGNPFCAGVSPLGTLEPHLHQYYPELFDAQCVTDQAST